ncbi:hypothetical protein TWF481_010104 [Arthrobotrys musiformis]|uniref:Uncharacterized protein n=1 Tax=Arthrobotrys musiformis TaxID=47236 RepID=A0AAV9W270_9PEZI
MSIRKSSIDVLFTTHPMAQRKGNGGRMPIDGQGREGEGRGFWGEERTQPGPRAGGSGGRLVEGVAEAETFRRGRELRWEQLGEKRRSAVTPPSPTATEGTNPLQADGHSRPHHQEDGHSLQAAAAAATTTTAAAAAATRSPGPIPTFKVEVKKKSDVAVNPEYRDFIREFFEDTRTKPRDETWIDPRFRRNPQVPSVQSSSNSEHGVRYGPAAAATTTQQQQQQRQQQQQQQQKQQQQHAKAQEAASRSARGLNPFAKPFVPAQFTAVPPPAPLSPEAMGKPKYQEYDRKRGGVSGHPAYQQRKAVDRSEYKFSPFAKNFVPSQSVPTVSEGNEPERVQENAAAELAKFVPAAKENVENKAALTITPAAATTKGGVFKSCTLYILHHAHDVGAGYEDVHQVYARRYDGEEKADDQVAAAIIRDAEYLLAGKYEETDLVAGGIKGSGVLKDGKLSVRMRNLLNGFIQKAKEYSPGHSQISLKLSEQANWREVQKRDFRFSQAEKCTDIEIEIIECGLATLKRTSKYRNQGDGVRGMTGPQQHLKELRERQAKFREETKKILDEMTRQRAVMFVRCSGNTGIVTGSTMVDIYGNEKPTTSLLQREEKPSGKNNESDLEANIEIAMSGPGALNLGLIDSEDDDGGVKLSPEEAVSWW